MHSTINTALLLASNECYIRPRPDLDIKVSAHHFEADSLAFDLEHLGGVVSARLQLAGLHTLVDAQQKVTVNVMATVNTCTVTVYHLYH